MKYKIIAIMLGLCISLTAFAQIKVKGTVTDGTDPLIGATVKIVGTTTGTVTDVNGKYELTVPNKEAQLAISYINYSPKQFIVGDRTVINISLSTSSKDLNTVVVVGFGTARKGDLTTSISSVKGDDVKTMAVGNVNDALQGKISGVQIVQSGGPGAQPKVLIRGISTISLTTDPLYVVDGIPQAGDINFLNPNEIESMEVLKDASATAIYGSRASNGVIMITTKRGKIGKIRFQLDLSYGIQMMKEPYKMSNSKQYVDLYTTACANAGEALPSYITDNAGTQSDWWGTGIRTASPQSNLSLSLQGGTEKNTYSVNLNYYKADSFYKDGNGDWSKFSARIVDDWKFNKIVSAGLTLNPRYQVWGGPDKWGDFVKIDPITPIYKPTDQMSGDENQFSVYGRSELSQIWNPVARDRRTFDRTKQYTLATTGYIQVQPTKGLTLRSQGGYQFDQQLRKNFQPDFVIDAAHERNLINQLDRNDLTSYNWSVQSTATYLKTINEKHHLSLMVGNTLEEFDDTNLKTSIQGLPNNTDPMQEMDAGTINPKVAGNTHITSILSFLGRATYNYNDTYYLTGSFRRDGSSKFLPANKWANFPSLSAAWRITNEHFMQPTRKVLNDLKFRLGWGEVGNQNLDAGLYETTLGQTYYPFGPNINNATYANSYANPDLKWETVEDLNIGFDYSMFRNRLSGTIEGYVKNTRDMLFQKYYPDYSGINNNGEAKVMTNIGTMQSKGIDVDINWHDQVGAFRYSIGLTFSKAVVKMTKISGDGTPLYGQSGIAVTKTVVGDAPGFFYGYKADGIFQNQTEINSHTSDNGQFLQPYARPGDIRFEDINHDGVLDDKDRVKLGSPWPDFTGGLNLTLGYNQFDLLINLYGSYGNDLVDQNKNDIYNAVGFGNKAADVQNLAWHGEGTSNDIPRLNTVDNNQNYSRFSSFYVEDGSFIRLKNFQVGYTLPKLFGFDKLRCYMSAQNLFTLTKYKGIDPEVAGDVTSFGVGGWGYPTQRTFVFGINASF